MSAHPPRWKEVGQDATGDLFLKYQNSLVLLSLSHVTIDCSVHSLAPQDKSFFFFFLPSKLSLCLFGLTCVQLDGKSRESLLLPPMHKSLLLCSVAPPSATSTCVGYHLEKRCLTPVLNDSISEHKHVTVT